MKPKNCRKCSVNRGFSLLGSAWYFVILSLLFFASCTPPTVEQQIEELLLERESDVRKKNAVSLADSLDAHPVELLLGLSAIESEAKRQRVTEALEVMLKRYFEIADTSDIELRKRSLECVRSLTFPNQSTDSLPNLIKIDLIIKGLKLKDEVHAFRPLLVQAANRHGETAMLKLIEAWYRDKNSSGILEGLRSFEDDLIGLLSQDLAKGKGVEDLLARLGEPAVDLLMSQLENEDRDIRFSAADALVLMTYYHPALVSHFTDAIDNKSTDVIAKNYPFYIRLGQAGTEKLLIKALRNNFSKNMCLDYLNCGNEQLEDAATDIAHENGYYVLPDFGRHYGPKWGSGN